MQKSVGSVCILGPLELYLESLGANLKSMHSLNSTLS